MALSYSSLGGANTIAQTLTAASANTLYESALVLTPGTYSIVTTQPGSLLLFSGSTLLSTLSFSSGTTTVNIGTTTTSQKYYVTSGSSVLINITLTGQSVANTTGTLTCLLYTSPSPRD